MTNQVLFLYMLFGMLLGHFIGDYGAQTKAMAQRKGGDTVSCLGHCWIYSWAVVGCVALFAIFGGATAVGSRWTFVILFVGIYISHFFIDRFSLADKWLQLIDGRSLTDYLDHGQENIEHQHKHNYHSLRGGFTSIVYCVVDNTMHVILMIPVVYYARTLLR